MSQEEQIRLTLARYPQVHDQKDAEGVAALFADDALFATASSQSTVVGRDAIRTFMAASYAKRPLEMRTKHLFGNPAIEIDGDIANATSDYVVYQCVGAGQWEIKNIGQAIDRLVRQNGHWVFAERRNFDARADAVKA